VKPHLKTDDDLAGGAAAVERLREVVLDLDRAKHTEKALREETAALLEGLRAIAEARSSDELFARLLGAMRGPLSSDLAIVLADPSGDGRKLSVIASTDPSFVGCEVALGKALARSLGGRVSTLFDTSVVAELCAPPFDRIASCVLLPLAASTRALILFGSHTKHAFGPRQEQLVKRLAPLANQALRDVERSETIARAHRELQAEVAERKRVEIELRLAQKLEAVGRLASGIAHEINTPVQYVTDTVAFLQDAYHDVRVLLDSYREAFRALEQAGTALAQRIERAEEIAEVSYLDSNVPAAFARTEDGLARVATLVRAMKSFGAPDHTSKCLVNLNAAITTTLTIAGAEWRQVAEIVTELGDLPDVLCLGSEMSQVFLNLIVNAAHAITDAKRTEPGRILIRTWLDAGWVAISVGDNGVGIPDAIRERIFEPFFTTKEVGRGSGQGLAITQSIVTKHGGAITVDSELGVGSTFTVRIPA